MTEAEIGKRLVSARGTISQRDLAKLMQDAGFPKWSHLTVGSVERGIRPLRLSEAAALHNVLACSPDLLAGLGNPNQDLDAAARTRNAIRTALEALHSAL